jgi:hypothetical protein
MGNGLWLKPGGRVREVRLDHARRRCVHRDEDPCLRCLPLRCRVRDDCDGGLHERALRLIGHQFPNEVPAIVEHGEHEASVVRGDAERRRIGGDSADPCCRSRHLENLVAREIDSIDVAEALAIRHEVQRATVGRELRIDVLGAGEDLQLFNVAGCHVHERQVHGSVAQLVEIGLPTAIGRERERLAVRRPRRMQLRIAVVRDLARALRLEVDQVQVADTAVEPADRDRGSVRTP